MRRVLVALLCTAAVAGCGNDVSRPPDTRTPEPPRGTREVDLEPAGVSFTAPFNWPALPAEGQRAGGIQSRRATVAVWRYDRSEPLPETGAELREVQKLLVDRVSERDPGFELRSARRLRRGGARAIELVGRQTIAGRPYDVRSTHIFHDNAEIVVDAYAPPEHFERVDRTVFRPLLGSLELS